jgi:glycosyltransferase involved in cell wall biosynthesis
VTDRLRVAFDGRSLTGPSLRGWDRYLVGLAGELVRRLTPRDEVAAAVAVQEALAATDKPARAERARNAAARFTWAAAADQTMGVYRAVAGP